MNLSRLIQEIQPWLVPLCVMFAWLFVVLLGLTIYGAINDTTARAKKMHQIPCSNCKFFTNDYRLKCTIHPLIANTEEAIDCKDYCVR
jgi:hypothetical protein